METTRTHTCKGGEYKMSRTDPASMDDQDWIETEEEKMAQVLPEAPASANLRVYIDGFSAQLTVRGTNPNVLVSEIESFVKQAKLKGWQPSWNPDTNKANGYTEAKTSVKPDSRMCEEHNVAMEKKWSEAKQKTYFIHKNENGKACFGKGYMD